MRVITEPRTTGDDIYRGTLACTASTALDTNCYYILGAEISTADYPDLEFGEVGTGQVRGRFGKAPGEALPDSGAVSDTRSFFDNTAEVICQAFDFADNSTRCVPLSIPRRLQGAAGYFADAACSTALFEGRSPSPEQAACPQAAAPTALIRFTAEPACGITNLSEVVNEAFELGPLHVGDAYILTNGGTVCEVAPPTTSPFYPVGAAIPFTDFAALTTRIE